MHEDVGAGEGASQPGPVLLEAHETHARRRAPHQPRPLRAVTKQHQYRRALGEYAGERIEHHSPPLLEREPPHTYQQGGAGIVTTEHLQALFATA